MTRFTGCVIGLAAWAVFAPPLSTYAAPVVHRIIIGTMAFGPSPSGIRAGDTVEWVNQDIFRHSVTAADKSFDVDLEPNASARAVMKTAGTIRYICKYHPSMQGQLIVAPAD